MKIIDTAYAHLADLSLWFKIEAEDSLLLSDLPSVIPLRWPHFRDKWEYFSPNLKAKISTYKEPDLLKKHIQALDRFISNQRNSPVINPFSSSKTLYKYYAVFDVISINDLNISLEERNIIQTELERVNRFTKTNFEEMKSIFRQARDELADIAGGTDAAYNSTFNRSASPELSTTRISDINKMKIFSDAIKTVDFILSNIFSVSTATVDPFALAKKNANNPDIDIQLYLSGQLTRLNHGESLQSLADRTLGSPDKWIDIAIANGLKPPYIDEEGEKIYLTSNGSEGWVNIPSTDDSGNHNFSKLYINQPIFVQSDAELFPDQRTIQSIKEIDISGDIIIELSGEKDLDKYRLADNAYIRVFQPNTVNSNFLVLIPSVRPLPDSLKKETPFFLQASDEDLKQAKIDLLLTEDYDLNFTSSGDLQMSYGLDNAVQAVKLKLDTERGSLKRHAEYGLINVVGLNTVSRAAAKDAIARSIVDQINNDARFERVEQLQVKYVNTSKTPNSYLIYVEVRLAGSSTVVPITFSVN